jgi:hypothetical protein
MTATDQRTALTPDFQPVALDLYRDVHKGIRAELFALTTSAGQLDPADSCGRADLAAYVSSVTDFLVRHAEHEDGAVQPVLETELPRLAARVAEEHIALERRMLELRALADGASVAPDDHRNHVHRLYRGLASFTSAYLAHQDVEERVIMPALEMAIGAEAVAGIHVQIVSNIPPDEMARSMAIMLPAMNADDRAEMLGGMRAGAPPEAFAGLWGLAGSVLSAADHATLGARLGIE